MMVNNLFPGFNAEMALYGSNHRYTCTDRVSPSRLTDMVFPQKQQCQGACWVTGFLSFCCEIDCYDCDFDPDTGGTVCEYGSVTQFGPGCDIPPPVSH